MSLSAILSANKLYDGRGLATCSLRQVVISKVCSHTYPMWEQKEEEVILSFWKKPDSNTTVSQSSP
jgi:hypothetical protein